MDRIGIRLNATVEKMKNFVVNLDRQPEKFERFLKRNEGCGIAFERFPAVDGSKLTDEEVMAMGIVANYFLVAMERRIAPWHKATSAGNE